MRAMLRVISAARELRPLYLGIIVCSVAVAATGLAVPFLIAAATDYVVAALGGGPSAVGPVIGLAAALLGVDLANTVISNVGGYLGDVMAVRLRSDMSQRYFAKLLALPQRYFDNELTGTIINRLSRSITEVTGFLNTFANNFFPMLITVGAVLVISGFYSWPLALLLIVIYPVFMWLTAKTSAKWQRLEGQKNQQLDLAGGRFAEVIGQIRVVKSFVRERLELTGFAGRFLKTVFITRDQSRYWHTMDIGRRAALNVIFFGVYALIFAQTVRGAFTIGAMVLLIQLVNIARQPVFSMSFMVDFTQRALAGSRDYFKVLDEPADSDAPALPGPATRWEDGAPVGDESASDAAPPASAPARAHTGLIGPWTVSFDGVTFGYDDGERVLTDVSFEAEEGTRIALVGESGGGKTTIASLLLGLYRPEAGAIRIGGVDIADAGAQTVRESIAMVFQAPSLFSGTVRENIAYGRLDATDDEVEQAARLANAHDFIVKFPGGYDAQIGERGLKLSGGQAQRISVARAIVKNAPILILDEATSSLDGKAERLVQEGLERLMAGRTTIVIAHRLSTIAGVDRIVTLKDGLVDEVGSPAELASTGGVYSELLALQASTSKKDRRRLAEFDILR